MVEKEKVMRGLVACAGGIGSCDTCPYSYKGSMMCDRKGLMRDVITLLKEQEPRMLSLGEAIGGKNGLEIDPYVFVEIKGREDIFIGSVNDASHYNYPDLRFGVGECFQINRSFPASKIYFNTDYMKTVRCWTHKPSKEQRMAAKWE